MIEDNSAAAGDSVATGSGSPALQPNYTMGMLCHLLALSALIGVPFGNILGPLVIWLIKKEEDSFVDRCGKESLNFQITATMAGLALGLISLVVMVIALLPLIGLVSLLLFPIMILAAVALFVTVIVFTVIASIKASEGVDYRYPYTIRLIK